jgi:hypothetical protein
MCAPVRLNPVLKWSNFAEPAGPVVSAEAKCATASSGKIKIKPIHLGELKTWNKFLTSIFLF